MAKKNFTMSVAEEFINTKKANEKKPDAAGFTIPEGYKLVRENKSARMQLLIRPAVKDAIKAEAAAKGVSMNDLVNDIFEEYLERKGK